MAISTSLVLTSSTVSYASSSKTAGPSSKPAGPIDQVVKLLFGNIQLYLSERRGVLLDVKSLFSLTRTCRAYADYMLPLWKSIAQSILDIQLAQEMIDNPLIEHTEKLTLDVAKRMCIQIHQGNIPLDIINPVLIRDVIQQDRPDLLQYLISCNIPFNKKYEEETPLSFASSLPKIKCMQVLIKEEVRVEAIAADTNSLLRLAAVNGDVAGVRAQLAAGADVNGTDPSCYTAVWLAAMAGHLDVLNVLLDSFASIHLCDRSDTSPLAIAAMMGNDAIVAKLIADYDADLESTDEADFTALIHAALTGQTKVVEILIENGADVKASACLGQTPLSVAQNAGHQEIVEILERALERAAANKAASCEEAATDFSLNPENEDGAVHPRHHSSLS